MNIKKGIFYVLIANIINLIINLVTTFFLPKYLSIDSYANIKLFNLYVTYLGILHFGFSDGMYLRLGGKKIDSISKSEVLDEFCTFKVFQVLMNVIMIFISLFMKNSILLLCSLIILPVNISNYIRNLYNAIGEFKRYSFYTNINTMMIFIINMILLFIIKTNNSYFYIISYVIVYFIYWMFIEHETRKIFGKSEKAICFKKELFKDDIKSGFLLMMGNFCNVIFTSIDRIIVKKLIGIVEFAYYSFAVSIENLMNVFITPISTTMYNYFCNNNKKEKVVKIKKYILLFSSIVIVVAFPAKFFIEHWVTKYVNSVNILFFLVAAQYAAIMIKVVHINLYKAQKRQNRYFRIMICIIVISLILNLIGYFILKNLIIISIATFITNLIWLIVGEIDLIVYHLRIKDYLYFILNIVAYLICGFNLNSIVGCLVYSSIVLINTLIIENDVINSISINISNYVKSRNRRV